jgi:hypothetical protein
MKPLVYFKLQAKNLFKDYQTKKPHVDEALGITYFDYTPKYFDIDRIFNEYDWDEENFSLMKAQHLFALMLGFEKWTDLAKASDEELELAKLLWDNQHKIELEDWRSYIAGAEADNNTTFDTASRIAIFEEVFANADGHYNPFGDYRLTKGTAHMYDDEAPRPQTKSDPGPQITSLPLSAALRAEFVEAANEGFENVMERIEPQNPELTRKLWNAGDYVDNELLREDMLPISKDYALSLIDSFLVHHVIGLATRADGMMASNN